MSEALRLAGLLDDEAVIRWMPEAPSRCNQETAANIITASHQAMQRGHSLDRAIVRRFDKLVVGEVTLNLRSGELAFWLGSEYWGQGYAREAIQATMMEAWKLHGLRQLTAFVHRCNRASSRLLESCGFRFAGLRTGLPGRENEPWLEFRGPLPVLAPFRGQFT
jgi:[ribosomal protein S5]-alanine N-acetyltransferase